MTRSLPALLLLVPAFAAAQDSLPAALAKRSVTIDRVAAIVGSEPILLSEVVENAQRMVAQNNLPQPRDSVALHALLRQSLDSLIDLRVLTVAARNAGVEVDEGAVNGQLEADMARIRSQFQNDDSTFRAQLREAGFASIDAFRTQRASLIRDDLQRNKYVNQLRSEGRMVAAATVTDAEVTELYEANKSSLTGIIGGYTFRQIVMPVRASATARATTRAKAESLYAQIVATPPSERLARFQELARTHSMDGSAAEGGSLPPRRRGSFVPEFEQFAWGLNPGDISPVFETIYGYHILRVDRRDPREVTVRHILLTPPTDSTDIEATRLLADSVAKALRAGAPFDSLAARYHDPGEPRTSPTPTPADSLYPEYATAIRGLKVNDVSTPFVFANPYDRKPRVRVLQVTSFEEPRPATFEDFRRQLRARVAYQKGLRRILDELRKEVYVQIKL